MKFSLTIFSMAIFPCVLAAVAANETRIEIGSEVLVPGVKRSGINIGGNSHYNGAMMKRRLASEKITGTIEFEEGDPKVSLVEEAILALAAGSPVDLAPFSMQAIEWEVE